MISTGKIRLRLLSLSNCLHRSRLTELRNTVVNHKQRKHNQSKGNDQLQTANHKDKRAIRDLTENPYLV